jgi:phage terminase large subunit
MGGMPNPISGRTEVYSWKKDQEGNIIGESPENKFNHACKALAYGLVDRFGFTNSKGQGEIKFF